MALEEPEYDVLIDKRGYEVRRYEPYVVAEVDVQGRSSDSQGFRTLAGYIFGDNDRSEKMQMTAPVETRAAEQKEATTYSFVMESKYTLDTLPAPNSERIRVRQKPARIVAVHSFSGRWSRANRERHEKNLLDALKADGIEPQGAPELARYNSPFTPWFMRRNELMVPIDWASETQ
ncbi:MAG: SOUL family heme-binding protein [Woeseiaceae bacterium]